jgi:uncharacterized membrane protein
MNLFTTVTVALTLIGCALIGGVFFAFSSFIMKALARLPSAQGMIAMQSINVVVLNPLFIGVFMGTAIVSVLVAILAVSRWELPASPYFLVGALLYITGTFLVTGLGNVPLNNQLASITATDSAASNIWQHYVERWTQLNTFRTVCALAASVVLLTGLLKY